MLNSILDDYNSIKNQLNQQPEHIFDFSQESLTLINPETKKHYKEAVLTLGCTHYSEPVELGSLYKDGKCPKCYAQYTRTDQLLKSSTYWAIQRFSQKAGECTVDQCCIIKGYYFHIYERDKKFYQILKQNDEVVKYLMEKKNDVQILSKYYQQKKQRIIITLNFIDKYEPICLLNNCKIHIPVRHQNCKHPECYDLVSLLEYTTELYKNNIKEKQMKCCKDNCYVRFPMNFDELKNCLVVDFELLSLLRKSPKYSLQFYYSNKDKKFHYQINGKDYFDEQIKTFIIQRNLEGDFSQFYNSVLKHMAILLETNSKIQKIQNRNKYRKINNINLMDPFIQKLIEYPIRCINCPLDKCCDVRTYFCQVSFTLKSDQYFQCPLCKMNYNFYVTEFEQLTDCLYLDFNLYFKKNQVQNNGFNYEGDEYFLHSFQAKCISKDKSILICQQIGENVLNYKNLKCSITKERLIYPLKIVGCQLNNYIDVVAYYQELQKIDFKSEQGLRFCNCGFCRENPIYLKDTHQEILLYDALFQEALIKLKDFEQQTKKQYKSINYCVSSGEIQDGAIEDQSTQFVADSEYQKKFQQQLLDGQYAFRITEVRQLVNDNQGLIFRQEGITKMYDDEIQRINENLANNKIYKQYRIIVKSVQYNVEWIKNVNIQ